MKMHKNVVIAALRQHPEDLSSILIEWEGTVEEAIAFLENDPRQWTYEFNREED